MSKPISVEVQLTVLKPVTEVYAAVLNPIPFFVEKASGPLEPNKTIRWKFPEMDQEIPIKVSEAVPNKRICMEWGSGFERDNRCDFRFSRPQEHNPAIKFAGEATTVSISESGWPDNDKGREASVRNAEGWMHMLCSLKAYLEHGVNLRTGAFLHMKF